MGGGKGAFGGSTTKVAFGACVKVFVRILSVWLKISLP